MGEDAGSEDEIFEDESPESEAPLIVEVEKFKRNLSKIESKLAKCNREIKDAERLYSKAKKKGAGP